MSTSADQSWLPADMYLAVDDEPVVRPGRPVCQGDVCVGLPVIRGAQEVKPQQWRAKAAYKLDALSMLVAHPCSSRSNSTHRLKDDITLVPVLPVPPAWEQPWAGYYELFPLPALRGGDTYVADLSRGFPVRAEYLSDRPGCVPFAARSGRALGSPRKERDTVGASERARTLRFGGRAAVLRVRSLGEMVLGAQHRRWVPRVARGPVGLI